MTPLNMPDPLDSVPDPPIVVLPVGMTTDDRPYVGWRGGGHEACQIIVSRDDRYDGEVVYDSGLMEDSSDGHKIPRSLPVRSTLFCHVRLRNAHGWSPWSRQSVPFRVVRLPLHRGKLRVFDLHYTRQLVPRMAYDHAHLVSALQGLVNRTRPRLYVRFVEVGDRDVDGYWMDCLREPGRWLEKAALETLSEIPGLVKAFRRHLRGVVLWDPEVPATAIVASTVAGAESLLPVCHDPTPGSLYRLLVSGGPRLPVVRNLSGLFSGSGVIPETTRQSTGSAKCDAYLWACDKYLATSLCNPAFMGYYIDSYWERNPAAGKNWQNHTLTNHDYFIARRAFFWDLGVWGDEQPVDDPGQPAGADRRTLEEILRTARQATGGKRMIHVGGFTPWAFKYTDYPGAGGTRGGVETEWETVRLLSSYNAYVDADALGLSAMANASVFMHMPLPPRYAQMTPPLPEELRRRGWLDPDGRVQPRNYLMHYVGDYDSAAWVANTLRARWDHDQRGSVPMAWAVNPNLVDRIAPFFEYAYRTRTSSDHFVAGDSGAGYLNPTALLDGPEGSGMPSLPHVWQAHCEGYYRRFGLRFTGFLINGLSGVITAEAERLYIPFSVDGVVNQYDCNHAPLHLEDNMPAFVLQADLEGDIGRDCALIDSRASRDGVGFLVFRSILRDPGYYVELNSALAREEPDLAYAFCTPAELAYLARQHLGGRNELLAGYLFDTIPDCVRTGRRRRADVAVRNDGWTTWECMGDEACRLVVWMEDASAGRPGERRHYELPRPVAPGDAVVIAIVLPRADLPGRLSVCYEIVSMREGCFSDHGQCPMRREVKAVD
jgi:hypothetical protein